nr:unnamed protein product [uncultured bacterium]
MKRLLLCVVLFACLGFSLSSCGSSWEFSGNNVTVTVCDTDTVVPRGTILLTPDSLR